MTPDDPVARRFVARSLVARVATLSAEGVPALTPLWFVPRGGRLFATTGAATLAARNLAANPAVAVLLDGELDGPSPQVLRLAGRARVRAGLPWGVMVAMARKYYLASAALRSELAHVRLWGLRARYYAQSQGVSIEIEPERAELLRVPR